MNVEGADAQFVIDAVKDVGWSPQAVITWRYAMNNLVEAGEVEKIGTSQSNVDRSKLAPGDVVFFGNSSEPNAHIGIYSGTYLGVDFMIHVANDRGPEIVPISWMQRHG